MNISPCSMKLVFQKEECAIETQDLNLQMLKLIFVKLLLNQNQSVHSVSVLL